MLSKLNLENCRTIPTSIKEKINQISGFGKKKKVEICFSSHALYGLTQQRIIKN